MNYNRHRYPAKLPAFTLVELLTVIAIIGVLAAIIIPVVGSVRSNANGAKAVSNAKQIGMATLLYAQDNRGQILGHGYDTPGPQGGSGYASTEKMFRQWAAYLNKDPNGTGGASMVKQRAVNIIQSMADPLVPDALLDASYGSYKSTWSVNSIFNVNGGRLAQGVGGYSSVAGGSPRTFNEFQEPSKTIYALSGSGYEVNQTNILNKAYLNPTGDVVNQIYYFHRGGTATPALFLDGHTALMSFPIDPKLTQNKAFAN